MASLNVLKGVRKSAKPVGGNAPTGKPQPKKQVKWEYRPPARLPGKAQAGAYNINDPFSFFIGKGLEEIDDAMLAIFQMKDQKKVSETIRKVRVRVPMSLLQQFFRDAKYDVDDAFSAVRKTKEYDEMNKLIHSRIPDDIELPKSPPKVIIPHRQPVKRSSKLLKYPRQILENKTIPELKELASMSGFDAKSMTRPELINELVNISLDPPGFTNRPYSTDYISNCASDYKSAPWLKDVKNVNGIALRGNNKFATKYEVSKGWFRASASWYEHVCKEGRKFEDYEVGYITRIGNTLNVIPETRQMYAASLGNYREQVPIGLGKAKIPRITKFDPTAFPLEPTAPECPGPECPLEPTAPLPSLDASQPILAPGLFSHLRALIDGTIFYCSTCNVSMKTPSLKSVHNGQKVFFCCQRCFDKYDFTAPLTSDRAAENSMASIIRSEDGSKFMTPPTDIGFDRPSTSSHFPVPLDEECGHKNVFTIGEGDVGQLGYERDQALNFKKVTNIKANVAKVSCGGMHTLVLTESGVVWSFGCNDDGALGRPTNDDREGTIPGIVALDGRIIDIGAGDSSSFAQTDDGRVYFWGVFRGPDGPIMNLQTEPVVVYNDTKQFACGYNHAVILDFKGNVFTVGCGEYGQLGRSLAATGKEYSLVYLDIASKPGVKYERVWAASNASFARDTNGNVYTWGLNGRKQLGPSARFDQSIEINIQYEPVIMKELGDNFNPIKIVGGATHTLILNDQGRVFAMGARDYGILGLKMEGGDVSKPTRIKALPPINDIACNDTSSYAVDRDGYLYSWGARNTMLGHSIKDPDDDTDVTNPTIVKVKEGSIIFSVSAGGQHAAVVAAGCT